MLSIVDFTSMRVLEKRSAYATLSLEYTEVRNGSAPTLSSHLIVRHFARGRRRRSRRCGRRCHTAGAGTGKGKGKGQVCKAR